MTPPPSTPRAFTPPRWAGWQQLLQAYRCAVNDGEKLWQWSVELSTLKEAGLTHTDIRWLVRQGFAELAEESTGNHRIRRFRRARSLALGPRTTVSLTATGAAHIAQQLAAYQQALALANGFGDFSFCAPAIPATPALPAMEVSPAGFSSATNGTRSTPGFAVPFGNDVPGGASLPAGAAGAGGMFPAGESAAPAGPSTTAGFAASATSQPEPPHAHQQHAHPLHTYPPFAVPPYAAPPQTLHNPNGGRPQSTTAAPLPAAAFPDDQPRVPPGPSPAAAPPTPKWDAARHELRLGDLVIKHFRRPAPTMELILSAFEEEGWPSVIHDPLPGGYSENPKRRLHHAVRNLNNMQSPHGIHFYVNGHGEEIHWELSPIPVP